MKSSSIALALAAASVTSFAFAGDVLGVTLSDGSSIQYVRNYSSDSGHVDIDQCTVTIKDADDAVLLNKQVYLTDSPIYCGDIDRSGEALFVYSNPTISGQSKHVCKRYNKNDGRNIFSNPVLVDSALCGH